MPVYNQAAFIERALDSLLSQSYPLWELLVIDDGSNDGSADPARTQFEDPRIHVYRLEQNRGLGVALNFGLDRAQSDLIAYLPADDVFHRQHLEQLLAVLEAHPEAVAAYSGVRYHYNRESTGPVPGDGLQLVQVMQRAGADRWMERKELVTDDLERMLWSKLRQRGPFIPTGQISCEWVDHPRQRHKILREPLGGINPYRQVYEVKEPLRFHTSVGNRIDEVEHFRRFRERPATPAAADGLKILLVGELSYNPERILALEERGHRLYGLWMPEPYWYNYVGPLPFGHVEDLPRRNWRAALRALQPDIIYALLNWQAVPFVRQVLEETRGIPSVWHFKEGPFISLEKGQWTDLAEIYRLSDGHIYTSAELRDWFQVALPGLTRDRPSLVLDGDLPKREWLEGRFSPRLSEQDGELHTVVPGRPIGLHPGDVQSLANNGIHLHFYGSFTQGQWLEWIEKTTRLAPRHIHLHETVDQERWLEEFSRYDAGWLHFFESRNGGDIHRANWDDLNIPARLATLAIAGLPVLQRDNPGALVATQSLARRLDIGLSFTTMEELRAQLGDTERMKTLRANVIRVRDQFTFDAHADDLIRFFRQVIAGQKSHPLSNRLTQMTAAADLSAADMAASAHLIESGRTNE